MKKFNWNKCLNILLVMLVATIFGVVVAMAIISPGIRTNADDLNPIEVGVDFKVGKLNREANSYVSGTVENPNGTYTYNSVAEGNFVTSTDVNNGIFSDTVYQNTFNMLYNHKAQSNSGTGIFPVENIYLNFGAPFSEGKTITRIISATGYLNGQQIEINNIKYEDYNGSGDPNKYNAYWFQYLDLTNIRQYNNNVGTGKLIEKIEGEYKFNFTYFYLDAQGNFQGQKTFTYAFNIINQNSYYSNYPTFLENTATRGKLDNNNVIQYFYNFDKTEYPTYQYDASRYNVSYVRTKNKDVEEITTSFALLSGNTDIGVLTINSKINNTTISKTFEIAKSLNAEGNAQFLASLELSDFGAYSFKNQYVAYVNNAFVVFDSITPYNFGAVDDTTTPSSNPYETGKYAKGLYNLHVFGVKAYFTKTNSSGASQKVELRYVENKAYLNNNTFVSDYSSRINEANSALSDAGSTTAPITYTKGFYNNLINVNNELTSQTYNKNQNFPSTNLSPISFDYFGNYYYENATTPASFYNRYSNYGTTVGEPNYGKFYNSPESNLNFGYITKDTYLTQAGYYEVVVKYNYSGYEPTGTKPAHLTQAFVFQIDNSAPSTTIHTTNPENPNLDSTAILQNSKFTNRAVFINWAEKNTYFNAPIRATITRTDFNGLNPTTVPYVKGDPNKSFITQKGKYTLNVYFGEGDYIYNSFSFTIDTDEISTPLLRAVDAVYNAENANVISGYHLVGTDTANFNNTKLINQPFTVTYNKKDSGAKITTTYKKIPFLTNQIKFDPNSLNNGAPGTSLNSDNKFILTNYNIDYKNISTKIDYILDYDKIANGEVSVDNIFSDNNSFIYLYTMEDEAGNQTSTFVIYDLTKPYNIVNPPINNPYNIVSSQANVIWGTHKMVPVLNSSTVESDNTQFFEVISNYSLGGNKLFKLVNNQYYMSVPITNVKFSYTDRGIKNYEFLESEISANTQVTLLPKLREGVTQPKEVFFSGEKIYDYIVTDASNITSFTSIAKSNKLKNTIWMNLDNSIGIAYASYDTSVNITGQAIKQNVATGANQLRFSYIPGATGSDYKVKNVNFTYYEFNPSSYTSIDSSIDTTGNITKPTYPYSQIASVANRNLTIDAGLSVVEEMNGESVTQENRVITNIINPTTQNGNIVTKEGMYVIKREYEAKEDPTGSVYGNDPIIRYYVYFVDRSGIISIRPEAEDITLVGNPTKDSIIYEVGNGISFKYSNNQNDTTKYTAKEIQQYLNYVGKINIFDSNKLPIKFNLPKDKFNTTDVLLSASNAKESGISKIINEASQLNTTLFQLKYKVSIMENTSSVKTLILDTTNDTPFINNAYVTTSLVNGINVFQFTKAGVYNVELVDNSNALLKNDGSITHKPKNLLLDFTISHTAPLGNYYGKYDDTVNSDKIIETKISSSIVNDTNNQYFISSNNKTLKFLFKDSENEFKAKIDPTRLSVLRSKNHGLNYETIYTRNGQPVDNTDPVLTFSTDDNGIKTYTLTIFDGYSDNVFIPNVNVQDEGDYIIKLQYEGLESDYNAVNNVGQNINYFYKNFRITVDTTAPEYNLNKLKLEDVKYDAYNNSQFTDKEKYFFALKPGFTFDQSASVYNELDTESVFVRKLFNKESNTTSSDINQVKGKLDFPDYEPTITPDNPNYNNGNYKPNSPRFSEANQKFVNIDNEDVISDKYYSKHTYSYIPGTLNQIITAEELFGQDLYGSGYYEIVERDEAGNYKVYAVQYNDGETATNQEIKFKYSTVGKTTESLGEIGGIRASEYNELVSGNNLQFSSITPNGFGLNDYFYKCEINYNGNTVVISNDPYNVPYHTTWNNFLNRINQALDFSKASTKIGYNITITFKNRFSADYVINYKVPGDRLEPIFKDEQIGFTITIPNQNDSTFINYFKVYRFVSGKWEVVSIDSNKKPITDFISESTSLGGANYYFSQGEYKFVLIDNFGRGNEEDKDSDGNLLYPPYYKGVGVQDINYINYGATSQNINGINYTSNTVTLDYNQNLYTLEVYLFTGVNGDGTNNYKTISPDEYKNFGITETMSAANKTTLTFSENVLGNKKRFRVLLNISRVNMPYVYNFVVTKELPNIEFKNTSGGNITTSNNISSPTVHTESFIIRWDTTLFSPKVDLSRTYTDTNSKQITENINNIANGYEVTLVGTYVAKITNNLGYTNSAKNVYFKLVDGEVIVYDVIALSNNIESLLKASPKTDIKTINNKEVVIYKYYALNTFNNPADTSKTIEIRLNKNKGIEMQAVADLTHDNVKAYRIYGVSNYAYERYIQIIYINAIGNTTANTFNVQLRYPQYNAAGVETEPATLANPNNSETMTDSWLEISWNSYNIGTSGGSADTGNIIFADYYFNGKYVKTFSDTENKEYKSFRFTSAGIHKFIFRDLAGNVQYFVKKNTDDKFDYLTINLVNNALFTVNSTQPIQNQIVNNNVILEITNRNLYGNDDPKISAKRNGTDYVPTNIGTNFYTYEFSGQGYYEVLITIQIEKRDGTTGSIVTKYNFTIINPKQALMCLNVPQNNNFRLVTLKRENADITDKVTNPSELWLSFADFGAGKYFVTLESYIEATDTYNTFTFEVWINDETPYLRSSIEFGTSTTKNITISYNPKLIYDQIGESYIDISGMGRININAESSNAPQVATLSKNQEYWIKVYSKDDKLVVSYKVTKTEPLNTIAIIVIVVAVIAAVGLTVMFILIRRHKKFK